MPIFLICAITLAIIIRLSKRKTTDVAEKQSEDFWAREQAASFARKKDISGLPYIKLEEADLPFSEDLPKNSELFDTEAALKNLFNRPVLDLSGFTNTDLKLNYGAANFTVLSAADTNYLTLIRGLDKWGRLLYGEGRTDDARTVFEYAVSIGSDIRNTYRTLGDIYASSSDREALSKLIATAEELDSDTITPIITYLNNLQ